MEKQFQTIEINGVKLEVDMRHARKIEELRIGSPVKCLKKRYSDYAVYPGVIIGFYNFGNLPTVNIAYLETDYSSAKLCFEAFNSETKDFEIVADVDFQSLDLNKDHILDLMDREIAKKETELAEAKAKKDFFFKNFDKHFELNLHKETSD